MKKMVTALCVAGLLAGGASATLSQDREFWYEQGQRKIDEMKQRRTIRYGGAKNVILFIGDGMGISTVSAARIFEGQLRGETGEENLLSFERFPFVALSKVYNTNQQTPDSAGTMTAMISGVKTKAGVIGVDDSVIRGDHQSVYGNELLTLVEEAEQRGLSTGVVTSARLTHATPAACYAHSPERNWEDDGDLPDDALEAGYKDIARQLIEFPYGDGLEVALGGGRRHFIPREMGDPEDEGRSGNREDGRNLTAEWTERYPNSAFVWNKAQFDAIDPASTDHLLGLFERSHLEYEYDRPGDTGGEPALSDLTVKAIEILEKNEEGFVLMVESGRIDHAHHASNAYRAMSDTIEFAKAIEAARSMTNGEDTLIIVTADHSHVFNIAGYPTRGNDILGLVVPNDRSGAPALDYARDRDGLPFTTVGYYNGGGYVGIRELLTDEQVSDPNYRQESAVPLSSETHSAEDVAIYADGPGAWLFQGVVEQNFIYHVMRDALRWDTPDTAPVATRGAGRRTLVRGR